MTSRWTYGLAGLVALVPLILLAAMWGGLIRIGWTWPVLSPTLIISHGALMIAGVLGTLISLERAVALKAAWTFAPPVLSGLGALAMILWATEGPGLLLITLGSLALVAVFAFIVRQHRAPYTVTMALGAAAWAVGNLLWLFGQPLSVAVLWWVAFLVLTIAGERLELSRVLRLTPARTRAFGLTVGVLLVGLVVAVMAFDLGMRLTGLGYVLLAAWLGLNDIARRTVKGTGLTRYIAACLLVGYAWLGVGGLFALVYGGVRSGPPYDAILHSILLGFVFSMILGHAPIIAPALLRIAISYDRSLYAPLVLLSLSLALRLVGDVLEAWELRRWGGLLNALVLLLFLGNLVRLARRGVAGQRPTPAPRQAGQ